MSNPEESSVSLPLNLVVEIEKNLRIVNRSSSVTDGALSNDSLFLGAAIKKELDKQVHVKKLD
jgi:hypothetical protein